jgi:hypothetical protein
MQRSECGKLPLVGHAPLAHECAPVRADGPGSTWLVPAIPGEVNSRSTEHSAQCHFAVTKDLARAVAAAAHPISRRRVSHQWRSRCWNRVRQWFSNRAQWRGDGPPGPPGQQDRPHAGSRGGIGAVLETSDVLRRVWCFVSEGRRATPKSALCSVDVPMLGGDQVDMLEVRPDRGTTGTRLTLPAQGISGRQACPQQSPATATFTPTPSLPSGCAAHPERRKVTSQ